jgi:threonine aldolase
VFSLSGDAQASVVVGASSAGTFSLSGSATGDVSVIATSSSTLALVGSATAHVQTEGDGADPAAVWQYVLVNGKSAQQTLVELHSMLSDLHKIHGLMTGMPLVVTETARIAGDVEQAITQVDENTVRVERV